MVGGGGDDVTRSHEDTKGHEEVEVVRTVLRNGNGGLNFERVL